MAWDRIAEARSHFAQLCVTRATFLLCVGLVVQPIHSPSTLRQLPAGTEYWEPTRGDCVCEKRWNSTDDMDTPAVVTGRTLTYSWEASQQLGKAIWGRRLSQRKQFLVWPPRLARLRRVHRQKQSTRHYFSETWLGPKASTLCMRPLGLHAGAQLEPCSLVLLNYPLEEIRGCCPFCIGSLRKNVSIVSAAFLPCSVGRLRLNLKPIYPCTG